MTGYKMLEFNREEIEEKFFYSNGKLFLKKNIGKRKKGDRAGTKDGHYHRIYIGGRLYLEHRVVFLMHNEYLPLVVDHIKDELTEEGIKSNDIKNLRDISQSLNILKARPRKGGSSSFKGVSIARNIGKWRAQIYINGKRKSLGYFKEEKDAAKAYDQAVKDLVGDEHSYLNFRGK